MFRKIYIEITNVCNLKCKFCPDTNRNKEFMSAKNFEEVINKIYKHTKLVFLHVKGEPLLHSQLDKLLSILEKYNLQANITTNGILIKEKLDIVKNSKAVRQINFSIHSVMQNENLNENYFEDIFKSVEELENVLISYRLWNLKNIRENNINDSIIKQIEKFYCTQNLKQQLTENEFVQLRKNVYINQDTEFTWPDINKKPIIAKGKCQALKDQIAILVDGTVVPCCLDNDGDIPLGNIFEETIEEILSKTKTKLIRENFEKGVITCELCKTCGFLKRLENKRKS